MKNNIENLRETINTIITERVAAIQESLSQEEINKINDIIYLINCNTCLGYENIKNIPKQMEEIAKVAKLSDLSIELEILSKNIDKIKEETLAKEKEEKAKEEPIEEPKVEEEDKDNDDVVDVIEDNDDVVDVEPELDAFMSKVLSSVNPNGDLYKDALSALIELNADDTSLIELRADFEESIEPEYRKVVDTIMFYGFQDFIQQNIKKFKDLDLSSTDKIIEFLSAYSLQLPGLVPFMNAFKNELFVLSDNFLEDGTPTYTLANNSNNLFTKEEKEQIIVMLDNTINQVVMEIRNTDSKESIDYKVAKVFNNLTTMLEDGFDSIVNEKPVQDKKPTFNFDNSKIITKFPKLKEIEELYHINKYDVNMKETKPNFIECVPYIITNDKIDATRKIYIDLGANIIDKTDKVFFNNVSQTCVEDCVCVKLSNTTAIRQFIYEGLTEGVAGYDELTEDDRNINKVIDMSSLPKTKKDREATIEFIKSECTDLIDTCISKEVNTRFKVIDFKDSSNFKLISDNSVPLSFLDNKTKRKTNFKIEVKNGKASLVNKK